MTMYNIYSYFIYYCLYCPHHNLFPYIVSLYWIRKQGKSIVQTGGSCIILLPYLAPYNNNVIFSF